MNGFRLTLTYERDEWRDLVEWNGILDENRVRRRGRPRWIRIPNEPEPAEYLQARRNLTRRTR